MLFGLLVSEDFNLVLLNEKAKGSNSYVHFTPQSRSAI